MGSPLDRVEVDTVLDELPERAQLAQEVHTLLDGLQDVVDLLLGGKPANTEANTGVGALVTVAEGTQDVAGLKRS